MRIFFSLAVESFDGHKRSFQCHATLFSYIHNIFKLISPNHYFPLNPWWLMPVHVPGTSFQNPLFKDYLRGHPWEADFDHSLWEWSFLWNGTTLGLFLSRDPNQTLWLLSLSSVLLPNFKLSEVKRQCFNHCFVSISQNIYILLLMSMHILGIFGSISCKNGSKNVV